MEFTEVIEKRRSIRKYKTDPIPDEILQKLYKALQTAPSGINDQEYKFIFIEDADKRYEIVSKGSPQKFLYDAPVLVIGTCKKDRSVDVIIAIDHMILEAVNQGLGTCWIGWFKEDVVKSILSIPNDVEVPIMVSLGWYYDDPKSPGRKTIEQLISKDRY